VTDTDLQRIDYRGHAIRILPDDDPPSPREYDNLGRILYTSHRYVLGDERVSDEAIREIAERADVVCLPVYAYIHGGIALNTTGFSCPWDSGQCGIVYVTDEQVAREYPDLPLDAARVVAEEVLRAEVEVFGQYLAGGAVGYVVERDGEHVASCWGFWEVEEAIEQAKAEVDADPFVLYPHPCAAEAPFCSGSPD
jgi:hypothetical protein